MTDRPRPQLTAAEAAARDEFLAKKGATVCPPHRYSIDGSTSYGQGNVADPVKAMKDQGRRISHRQQQFERAQRMAGWGIVAASAEAAKSVLLPEADPAPKPRAAAPVVARAPEQRSAPSAAARVEVPAGAERCSAPPQIPAQDAAQPAPGGHDLRALAPLVFENIVPAPVGPQPVMDWVPLDRLVISGRYQRDISRRSRALIRRAVEAFDWALVKPLSVAARDDGRFEVLDGQHTALILRTHGAFTAAPCFIVGDKGAQAKAAQFVGLNTNRLAVTPVQKFFAAIEAGDAVAASIASAAVASGVTICRAQRASDDWQVGDTVAVAEARAMIDRRGEEGLAAVWRACVQAELAPVTRDMMRAVEYLLHDPAYAGEITSAGIAAAIRRHGERLIDAADLARITTGNPVWHQIAIEIFKKATGSEARA